MAFKSSEQRKGFFANLGGFKRNTQSKIIQFGEKRDELREKEKMLKLYFLEQKMKGVEEKEEKNLESLEKQKEYKERLEELDKKQAEAKKYLFEHSFAGKATRGIREKITEENAYKASPEGQEQARIAGEKRTELAKKLYKKGLAFFGDKPRKRYHTSHLPRYRHKKKKHHHYREDNDYVVTI
jgi:hypothetical protein